MRTIVCTAFMFSIAYLFDVTISQFYCGPSSYGPVFDGVDFVALKDYFYTNGTGTPDFLLYPMNKFMGDAQINLNVENYTFWFLSEENKNKFAESPTSYYPQLGGYCAFGLTGYDSQEPNPPGYGLSPTCLHSYAGYTYIQHKLYTFLNLMARNTFMTEYDGLINQTEINFGIIMSKYNDNAKYCFNTNKFAAGFCDY